MHFKTIKFTPSRAPVNQKINQLTKWWPGTVVTLDYHSTHVGAEIMVKNSSHDKVSTIILLV